MKGDSKNLETTAVNFLQTIDEVITKHDITTIITETPVGSQSFSAVKALSFCQGLVYSLLLNKKITLFIPIQPKTAKKEVFGNGNLDKTQIMTSVLMILPSSYKQIESCPKYLRETVCDCLVLYTASR